MDLEEKYKLLERIGEGSFSIVHKARECQTNVIVAIKRISFTNLLCGIPSPILREVALLKEMHHPNIARLLDVIDHRGSVDLVFEYMDFDLKRFISRYPDLLKPSLIKSFLYQILCGVAYCHGHRTLHRDLKPRNLLIDDSTKTLKVADFGLARAFSVPTRSYTAKVGTLYYRAPEVLLGSTNYSFPIDMWAVGCIFAEMIIKKPLFRGHCEIDILFEIYRLFGMPDEHTWPGVSRLPGYEPSTVMFDPSAKAELADVFNGLLEQSGIQLLCSMLTLNPASRITASDALKHVYFLDHGIMEEEEEEEEEEYP